MKFRKKPVVIEAHQYHEGDTATPGLCWCDSVGSQLGVHVETLEGPLKVSDGDWIITGVKGERYPCKPDIFEATYEKVDA